MKNVLTTFYLLLMLMHLSCKEDSHDQAHIDTPDEPFYTGADLSYVNQILDHGGTYKDDGTEKSPYEIFKLHGANIVRLRLWHNPVWTKEVYGGAATQLYNDLADVAKSIRLAKDQGMAVLLDIHYSDSWADPGKQEIPEAWKDITDIDILADSVYNYTASVFSHLVVSDLVPEFVQVGNETNCGMLYTNASAEFPACNVCEGQWQRMGIIVNSALAAVQDATESLPSKTKTVLHVADPKNVEWWFDNMLDASKGNVDDFDVIGISYYPIWHTTVTLDKLSETIASFRSKYKKPVMIVETAYPWTTESNDNYNNVFGTQSPLPGYPFTTKGQYELLIKLSQEVFDGGGEGVIYWEPAWISSGMKDLWGTGSSWENCTFFDFTGNTIEAIDYMKHDYK